MELGAPMAVGMSNPFVETARLLLDTPDRPANETPLAEFFATFQPRTAEELLGISAESPALKALTPWETQLPWIGGSGPDCARYRRDAMAQQAAQFGRKLTASDGYNSFGPVSSGKLELEVDRLRSLVQSIKANGYDEDDIPNLPTARVLVSEDGRVIVSILEGNHRAAVLAAMGIPKMSFLVDPKKTVREMNVSSWAGVREGTFTISDAKKVLARFLSSAKPEIRNH